MVKVPDLASIKSAFFSFFKAKSNGYASISISPSGTALLELDTSGNRKKVQCLSTALLNADTLDFSNEKSMEALVASIQQAKSIAGSLTQDAAIAITSEDLMTKTAKMPAHIKAAHREAYVHGEARKLFPGITDQIYLDFFVDETIDPKDTAKNNLTLYATYKKKLAPLISALAQSGLEAKILDVDYCALERAYPLIAGQLPPGHTEQYTAIINVDTHAMLMVVMHKKKSVYHHFQRYNGSMLKNLVQHHLGLTSEESPHRENENREQSSEPSFSITAAQSEQLVNQIQLLLHNTQSFDSDIELNHLVLSGRCAVIPKLAELIQERTDIPTSIANPFSQMQFSSSINTTTVHQHAPAFLLNCGLALHGPITW